VDQLQESFSATGIDDALELMEVVNAKTDKASTGAAAANLERHPERRFKARYPNIWEVCYEAALILVTRPHSKRIRNVNYQNSEKKSVFRLHLYRFLSDIIASGIKVKPV
jgi:Coiled-coil domain-containing protein 124 /Oxs1